MALNKEIWLSTVVDNFFPAKSFVTKSIDDSAYCDGKRVHIPNAGKPSGVQTNRSSLPASVKKRTDNDLVYEISEHTSDPVLLPDAEKVELSYDKRNSLIVNDRAQLQEAALQDIIYSWGGDIDTKRIVETSGANRNCHTSSTATGTRKKLVRADIWKLMTAFNSENIPQEGRYLMLDAYMYSDLIEDMTEADKFAFLNSADAANGVLGKFASFNIVDPRPVLRLKSSDKKVIKWGVTGEATELAAGLAWQDKCVSRALGETKMFGSEEDPTYYGDIYSFLVRAGGSRRRYDGAGVALLVETTGA